MYLLWDVLLDPFRPLYTLHFKAIDPLVVLEPSDPLIMLPAPGRRGICLIYYTVLPSHTYTQTEHPVQA